MEIRRSKKSVDEGGDGGAFSQYKKDAQEDEEDDDGEKPPFFPHLEEFPEFHQYGYLAHWFSLNRNLLQYSIPRAASQPCVAEILKDSMGEYGKKNR